MFAAELLRMYQKYADLQSWRLSAVSESQAENGGLKEAVVEVGPPAAGSSCCSAIFFLCVLWKECPQTIGRAGGLIAKLGCMGSMLAVLV